ncbi:MAG: BON domain-containing protein [Armatimonadetes bacterium]|nr:BON domain-containing protein [Armatimonadota bacterium]
MASLTDDAIERQVEQAIGFDPKANVFDMKVQVRNGVVRLEGIVGDLEAKLAAGEAAGGVPGVRRVDNTLTVEDPRGRTDREISDAVGQTLEDDPSVDTSKVGVTVLDSTAHLVGRVDSASEEEAAVRAASRAGGVKEVVSELDVASGIDTDWVDLKNRVTDALDDADDFYPYSIDVAVETDGRVGLSGEVGSEGDCERAGEMAGRVAGVKAVDNRLAVRERM